MTKECCYCKVEFRTYPSHSRQKYCSRTCLAKGRPIRRALFYTQCQKCGKQLSKLQINGRNKFCSRICCFDARTALPRKDFCDLCRRKIYPKGRQPLRPRRGGINRFCSRKCFEKFRKNLPLSISCNKCGELYSRLKHKGQGVCEKCYATIRRNRGSHEIEELVKLHRTFVRLKYRIFKPHQLVKN